MIGEIKRIDEIYTAMFDAAECAITFDPVLNLLIEYFGGAAGVIFQLNRKTGEISNWIGPGLEPGEGEYADRLNAINPRMRYSLSHAAGHVCYEQLFTDETKMDNSEFYQAIERLAGVRYFLGSRMYDVGDVSVFHSIEFTRKHGHPDKDQIEAFKRISKNLGQAWKISRAYIEPSVSGPSPVLLDHFPWAIFAVSREGIIQPQNSGAVELVEQDGPFNLIENRLKIDNTKINEVIAELVKCAFGGHSGAMKLPTIAGSTGRIAQIIPILNGGGATLFIRDARQSFDYFDNVLPDLFGLTAIEIKIVKSLSRGDDLSVAAAKLGRSRNTVRNHLQKIYNKAGASNRTELLGQVLGLVKPVS